MATQITFKMPDLANNVETIQEATTDPDKKKWAFEVISFEGYEAVSKPYKFVIELRSEHPVTENTINKDATLTIKMSDAESSYNGIITDFSKTGPIKDKVGDKVLSYYKYRAVMLPRFTRLGMHKKSDVFINKGFQDIQTTVLSSEPTIGNGLDKIIYEISNKKKFVPSNDPYNRFAYVCQYEETNLDFLSRLMEREGIYYFFNQVKRDENLIPETDNISGKFIPLSKEEIIFANFRNTTLKRGKNVPDASKPEKKKFQDNPLILDNTNKDGAAQNPNDVYDLTQEQKLLPKQVIIMNYGYEKTNLGDKGIISYSAPVSNEGVGDVKIYGENFVNPDKDKGEDGEFLAKIRAEEIYCRGNIYKGKSTAIPLMPGMEITLNGVSTETSKFFILEVIHKGEQRLQGTAEAETNEPFYVNTFVMIPLSVQFRPERITPRPKIYGTMNAFVGGEKVTANNEKDEKKKEDSKYAQIDKMGRYKVKLPFLAASTGDGNDSVWIRMASPYASADGKTYGMNFPLHKGTEVVLSFRDGDPDQPVITGALFNSGNPNVVTSKEGSDNHTKSIIKSAGGHQIIMNDEEGKKSFGMFCSLGKEEGKEEGSWLWVGNEDSPSFELKSKGSKHEVVCGQEDSIVLGSENWITVGSRMEALLGTSSDFTVGVQFDVDAGATSEVKFGPHLEFGKTTERIKEEDDLLGTNSVTIAAGLSQAEKLIVDGSRKGLTLGVAAFFALAAALSGEAGAYAFPHEEEGSGALKSMYASMFPAMAATVAEGIALGVLAKKLNPKNFHPLSKIELDGNGIKVQTDDTAHEGIKIGIERDDAPLQVPPTKSMQSFIEIKPYHPPQLNPDKDNITINNNKNAVIEMDKGATITIKRVDDQDHDQTKIVLDQNKIEITGPGDTKMTLGANNQIVMKAGNANNSPTITMTGNSIKMEQGDRSFSIDQGSIKMKLGNAELALSSEGVNQQGNFIKLG